MKKLEFDPFKKPRVFVLKLTEEIYKDLKKFAEKNDIPMAEVVRKVLKDYFAS